ncbi:alcohol dehydrogenase [Stemphylium lycopersici]|uniref:Alcohol dehydrogenase n=1 Tax=Stemphylium lycopersici TaxID=183478 RepID=A0A364N8T4_STELY|nr:alcohol dehydrogenase [Stemphylium lycopersici]RAR13670.1 alcohol dehydrogenase [Stemphylium lycopersici]
MSYPSTYTTYRRSAGNPSRETPLTVEKCQESLPQEKDLGPKDVVIKIYTVSLNYRDAGMLIGNYSVPYTDQGIPCSDCAAEVVGIGSEVREFKQGDRVSPICGQGDFDPTDDANSVAIGASGPGVLREYAVYKEKHLVQLPNNLSWGEGSMLPCAGVTAWNALDSLKTVQKHSSALLQGTGGVSMFSLILCLSAGITPIITSSSDDKIRAIQEKFGNKVRSINYKTQNQGEKVKELTNGRGVDFVVNNTGVGSLVDDISYLCERGGTVSLVGFLAGFDADWKPVQMMDLMKKAAKLKGIAVGSRQDFVDMNKHIEDNKVQFDVMLDTTFSFEDAQKAFDLQLSGNFSGKLVIKVAE